MNSRRKSLSQNKNKNKIIGLLIHYHKIFCVNLIICKQKEQQVYNITKLKFTKDANKCDENV